MIDTTTNLSEDESTDIAIIGMAGRFPGAATVDEFWQNLCNEVEAITHFSDEELLRAGVDPELLHDPHYVKAGAILEDIDQFDAAFFGLTPQETRVMDPQQRLFLETASHALENAGYNPETYQGTIGLYGGSAISTYLLNNLFPNKEILESVGALQIILSNDKDSLTTRVAYLLNLTGPCYTVQTYCSTSLVATCIACSSLLNGECDMALAGGVAISVPQKAGYSYQEGGIASPDARCRAFDAQGNGSPLGNGVGLVVLKRLNDALQDGDSIHAVIKGSAINNDGALKVGYTAPGVRGQTQAILEAQANAGVQAEDISYIEAHGTGTAIGDVVELTALIKAFRASTTKKNFCALGSVKTNVGHLDRAAGVTGLIKTTLALKHKLLPASLNYTEPNPQIDLENSPFYVNTKLTEWKDGTTPRRAGVSAFGIGGTNAHIVLEEAPTYISTPSSRSSHLLLLSARTEKALDAATKNLETYLRTHPDTPLADIAYTLQVGRKAYEHRRAFVCRSHEDALLALTTYNSHYGTAEDAEATLQRTLGEQWVAGVPINWQNFSTHERRQRVPLPGYPFERQRYWIDPPSVQAQESQLSRHPGEKKTDRADWFYQANWQKQAEPPPIDLSAKDSLLSTHGPFLLLLDRQAVGTQLMQQLLDAGQVVIGVQPGDQFMQLDKHTYCIQPQEPNDYKKILQHLSNTQTMPKTIVYCWSIDSASDINIANFTAYSEASLYSLLHLVRALDSAINDPIQLLVVTNQGQWITESEELHPEQSMLAGMCMVISQEYVTIAAHNVDIDIPRHATPEERHTHHLLEAIVSRPTGMITAYRKQQKWLQALEPIHLALEPITHSPLRQKGVYLITGGLGNVGFTLASYLTDQVQARLALLSHAPLPPQNEWNAWIQEHGRNDRTSQKIMHLQELEAKGAEILLLQADVADEQQMRAALQHIDEHYGVLHGIIHAAGVTTENAFRAIEEIGPQECQWHFHSKVHGVLTLETILQRRSLDFCVLFSSLSATLGGLGFVAYTAANAFMDSIVHQYNRSSSFPWLSIDWDTWQFAQEKKASVPFGQTVARYAMTPEEGTDTFIRILTQRHLQHIIVSTGDLQTRIQQWIQLESLQDEEKTPSFPHTPAPANEQSTSAPLPEKEEYTRIVSAIWQGVLGIDNIGLYDNFFELGGNSLLGLQVIARLKKAFHKPISAVALFEAPTISSLVKYLLPEENPVHKPQINELVQRRLQARKAIDHQGIAIIGMAARFPGATTLEQFWQNLRNGVESITFFSDEELLEAGVDPTLLQAPNYIKARPVLEPG